MKLLEGKNILITGASRGIGNGIAVTLASHGANIFFTYVNSKDSAIALEEKKLNKKLKYFIQVNVGNEEQKAGVSLDNTSEFVNYCVKKLGLDVIGLMALPPQSSDTTKYFKIVSELNNKLKFKDLSLGMSADYIEAIKYNSTFIRVGSTIFGNRG